MNDERGNEVGSRSSNATGEPPRLADALLRIEARESGGIVGADRYDYQKDWALCKILDLHEKGGGYVVVCEYHEDITVLDHHADPSKVTFYQIKTDQKNNWTVRRLIARKKGAGADKLPSILGNLFSKSAELAGCDAEFRFASNAKYSIKSASGASLEGESSFLCINIDSAERTQIKQALLEELKAPLPHSFDTMLGFEVAELGLSSHQDSAAGKLANFLDKYAAGCAVSAAPFYRAIFDELRRLTVAKRPSTSLEDVCKVKGISRDQFDGMLTSAVRATPVDHTITLIQQDLILDGTPAATLLELIRAARKYFVRRLNSGDVPLQQFRRRAVETARLLMESGPHLKLLAVAKAAFANLARSGELRAAQLSEPEVIALIMVELYEGREPEISTPGSESSQA